MKKVLLILGFISLAGCTLNAEQTTINGVSFSNPQNLIVSADEMPLYQADPDISITIQPISEYIKGCLAVDEWREYDLSERTDYYKKLLGDLREFGKSTDLRDYDSMSCNNANGNLSSEYTKVDGMNAIVYDKAIYQEVGSLSVFYKQVLFVDEFDRVYDIVFSYDFGELGNYLATIREGSGAFAYPNTPENWKSGKIEAVWQQVVDYFEKGKPITDPNIKGFEDNEKVIDEIIKSIKVDKNNVMQTYSTPRTEEKMDVQATEVLPADLISYDEMSPDLGETGQFMEVTQAYILIDETEKSDDGKIFTVHGETSNNCSKIVVKAYDSQGNNIDTYELKNYKYGDTSFKYRASESDSNLESGRNQYLFTAYCDGNQEVQETKALTYIKPFEPIKFEYQPSEFHYESKSIDEIRDEYGLESFNMEEFKNKYGIE